MVKEITVVELKALLDSKPDVHLYDVRTEAEREAIRSRLPPPPAPIPVMTIVTRTVFDHRMHGP